MIDREISDSRKIANLESDTARMAYAFILPHVDREGRMEADPLLLSGQVFTRLAHMTADAVEECLADLARVGLIVLYQVGDEQVLQITNFHRHNTPHHKEPASKYPPPPGEKDVTDATADDGGKHGSSMDQAQAKHEPTSPIINRREVKGREENPPQPPQQTDREPPPMGEVLQELTNESPIDTLRREAPAVHKLFEEFSRLQSTSYRMQLAQADRLLERVRFRGAAAVEASLRTIGDTVGDGGKLFSRALAHLDRQKPAPAAEVEHDDSVSGDDLLDFDAPLGGKWGAN